MAIGMGDTQYWRQTGDTFETVSSDAKARLDDTRQESVRTGGKALLSRNIFAILARQAAVTFRDGRSCWK
jgi:hypothetical protein